MPATAADYFGVRHAGAIYGLMILGCSAENYTVIAVIALASMIPTVIPEIPRRRQDAHEGLLGDQVH